MVSTNGRISGGYRIGIIGAGSSGTYLANLLLQQGHRVDLFERAPAPRAEGCGILVIRSGMEALQAGNPELCQKILKAGNPVKSFEFRNLRGEAFRSHAVEERNDLLPRILIHRKDILEALLETVPEDCLHLNARFESAMQSDRGVVARFQDGSQWEGDLLVGSDGIASKVREFVVPGVKPFYLGDIVWRGITRDRQFCKEGQFIVYTRGRGIYANFFDLGGDRTHWGFFIEAELDESEAGKPRPNNISLPLQELAKLPEDARNVIASTPPEQIACRYSYDLDCLPQLYRGRIVLVGDAAHAKSPTQALGMTSGWEDALRLSHHLATRADIDEAIANFQAERMPIVHEYQRESREMSLKIGRRRRRSAA
ncbi:MAG: FAD-dependent monooxygenase [Cyanobacteria bacterium SBLK]|nr:FAD-dependent monooxygenase [Cyanobacteria bacterium SBLK]